MAFIGIYRRGEKSVAFRFLLSIFVVSAPSFSESALTLIHSGSARKSCQLSPRLDTGESEDVD